MGSRIKNNTGGFVKPISGLNGMQFITRFHTTYSCSRSIIKSLFGMWRSSQKKIITLKSKNKVTHGVNSMLPIGDKREKGSPQQIKIGSDMSDIKI